MPRVLNKLGNARQVAALKKDGWHSDGGGLYLRVKGGSRSWVLVRQAGGKRVERGLGGFDDIGLADVRDKARNFVDDAPVSTIEMPLFGKWSDDFVDGIEAGFKNERHRAQWRSTLLTHAAALRPLRLDAVDTDAVVGVLKPIWTTKNETASRLRGRIERILDAAAAKGFRDPDKRNPATWNGHLEHFLPKRPKKSQRGNHAAVPWQEAPAFWRKLDSRRDSTSVQALRFTILTAARTGEVIGARVCEFDFDAAVWTVPKERMKMGLEHSVPLSPPALAIARAMTTGLGPNDYVFPGGKDGKHLSNMAMLMLLKDDMGHKETVHGFRSTFRDWAGDATDFPRDVAEMALAHAVGDATEAAYRRGRALEKRRPLMEAWANYLAG